MRIFEINNQHLNELRYAQLVGDNGIITKLKTAKNIVEMQSVMSQLVSDSQVTEIGEGFYGIAYRGKDGYAVLKISRNLASGSTLALNNFYKICKDNRNFLFPKIYMYDFKTDNSFWVLLENLNVGSHNRSLLINTFGTTMGIEIDADWNKHSIKMGITDVAEDIKDFLTIGYFTRSNYKSIEEMRDAEENNRTQEQKENFNLLVDFITQIVSKSKAISFRFDLHVRNMGVRKNGQVAFFDPIA